MTQEIKSLMLKLYSDIKFANQAAAVSINQNQGLDKAHFQISAFYHFLLDNENLTDDEIREILNSNNRFSFLRKLDSLIPNFFEELKRHGISYIKNLYNACKNGTEALNVPRI